MIIDLRDVEQGSKVFDVSYSPEWWIRQDEFDPVLGLRAPIKVHLEVERVGRRFFLKGRVTGELLLQCDRCAEEFLRPMDEEFELIVERAPKAAETEKELKKEDLLEETIEGDDLELDAIVREQIYLFLPMKCLCDDSCKGICPTCGTNLNQQACECAKTLTHPAFGVLKKLL